MPSPAIGVPGAPATSPAAPGAMPSPVVSATLSAAASPAASPAASVAPPPKTGWTNFLIDNFQKGGPIMWPILIVSIIAVAVVLERAFWWIGRWMRRDPKRIEKVFTAIETGDVTEASRLSRGSRDPVLRMMWNGLNHQHASLQGALQVAAGIEIKRAGRFLVVMDTLVTLAPLLGLLGTITGLIRSFSFLGNEELTAILGKVHQENPDAKVFVRGDRDTVHGNIIRVLDILRSQGFYKIAFEIKSQAGVGVPSAGTGQP